MINRGTSVALTQALKIAKDNIGMYFPNLRDATANSLQSLVELLEARKRLLDSMDNFFQSISGLPCEKSLFDNFIKVRDLEKDFITIMKIKLDIDKRFLELLDKYLYIATTL